MSQSLHVLLIEDSEDDAQLLVRELRRGGYSPTIQRVETPEEMKTALEKFHWDLVVSDYSMPHFNGLSALYLLRQSGQDLPFILISGTIGESVAVEAMKAGAHDYLMKDKLDRLIPAVQRELKEAQERRARRAAEEFARQSESRFRSLAENIKEVFWITDAQGETIEYISPAYREIWGRDPSEPHQSIYVWLDHIHPEDRDYVTKNLGKQLTGKYDLEYRIVRPDGSLRWIHDRAFPVRDAQGRVTRVVGIAEDISRYKEAESEIRLLQDLTASAAECPDFTSALETVLQKICQATGWDLGEAWIPNQTKDALECSSAFYSSLADLREFYKQSRDIRFSPGQGLPGRVWESKKPQWVKDIPGDENFLRADLAKKFGLQSAMAMPVVANNETVAVIGFFVRTARDQDERFIEIVSTCAVQLGNIFNTKLAEESQRRSEALMAEAQQIAHVGGWEMELADLQDMNKNRQHWTEESYRIFGYEPGQIQVTFDSFFSLVHPEDRRKISQATSQILKDKKPLRLEFRIIRPDGSQHFILAHVKLICDDQTGRPVALSGSVQDITEQKKDQEAQQEKVRISELGSAIGMALTQDSQLKEMLRQCTEALVRNLDAAFARIWTVNDAQDTLELQASSGLHTHLDGPHARVPIGKFKIGLIAQERKPHLTNSVVGDPRVDNQEWAKREGMVSFAGYPLIVERRLVGVMAVFARHTMTDFVLKALGSVADEISLGIERKRAELILRRSEERFFTVFQKSPYAASMVTAADRRIVDVNEQWLELFGPKRERLIGRSLDELAFWADPLKGNQVYKELLAGQTVVNLESSFFARGGEICHALVSMELLKLGGESVIIIMLNDISQQKKLEEQFRQAQKMEAVGQLAGGVAHDFNNLLTLVIGYSESMLHGINPGHPFHKDLEGIRKAAERASGLTRQLLAFSRRQILQPKVLNLNSIIQDAEKMLRRLIGEHIELKTELEKPLGKVKVDPGQMEQVLMNLAVNSRDAMPQGGTLSMKTSNLEVDQKSARKFPDLEIGTYVQLEVTDTGCGMDAETKKHIFEPFFTTKESGKGTGLGLSTVYGIVKQSKGHLLMESEPNQGTTFRLFLPLTEEKAGSIQGEQPKIELPQGSETLLLVEDEEELRLLIMDLLVEQGYKVLDASNGLEAISVCQSYSDPIDLIITDIVMPKMGGMALTESLKTLRPGIKVLYVSGYTDDLAEQQRLANTGVAFLQKPFTPSALACKIREVLEQKALAE